MPLYVRIQRQRAVLKQRVKIPATINQFATKVLKKDTAATLFKLLGKYRPETRKARQDRLKKQAAAQAENKEAKKTEKPQVIKYGLAEVTQLIEKKQAKLVVIAHDVNPIELVVFLPALCRKMNVPYVIVKNKSRLGYLVHKKQCAVLALDAVAAADAPVLQQIVDATVALQASRVRTGGLLLSIKTKHKLQKRAAATKNTIKA
jgi:large subunit ribosomal protein L7Ae